MAEQPDPRVRSPFAIPVAALVADADVGPDRMITVQTHQPPNGWAPSGVEAEADGDGD